MSQAITESQKIAAKDYTDSFKRAISSVASRTSALLWPFEEHLQFPSEYYNNICSQMSDVVFSLNPAALKRDESIIALIEVDLAEYLDVAGSPTEKTQNILSILSQKATILFKSLYETRNYSGVVISIGSSREIPAFKSSELIACFETPQTQVYCLDGHFEFDLGLKSGWNPKFLMSVGINAIADIQVLQYKALRFNTASEPINIPIAREQDAPVALNDELAPVAVAKEDAEIRSAEFDLSSFADNPLFPDLKPAPFDDSDVPESTPEMIRSQIADNAKKTLESEVGQSPELLSVAIPCEIKDVGARILLLTSTSAELLEDNTEYTNVVWNDDSFLAFSVSPVKLGSTDLVLAGAFTKVSSHLKNLDVTSANGSAFETIMGLDIIFADCIKSFIRPTFAETINTALKSTLGK